MVGPEYNQAHQRGGETGLKMSSVVFAVEARKVLRASCHDALMEKALTIRFKERLRPTGL